MCISGLKARRFGATYGFEVIIPVVSPLMLAGASQYKPGKYTKQQWKLSRWDESYAFISRECFNVEPCYYESYFCSAFTTHRNDLPQGITVLGFTCSGLY